MSRAAPISWLEWICPACRGALCTDKSDSLLQCRLCPAEYPRRNGIWQMLPPERVEYYRRFLDQYRTVREAEGRFLNAAALRALPDTGPDHPDRANWQVRARSCQCLLQRVVEPLEAGRPLAILDLGAGNGWLSHRLAERGHLPTAVDIWDAAGDGLACLSHYPASILGVRAEFDRLPWVDGQFDLAVFNASLHYSGDCGASLAEAWRVIRPGGLLVVMDTPVYRASDSGRQMVRERERAFQQRFGFPSNAVPMENFLTPDRLQELAHQVNLKWRWMRPRFGWRWSLRRLKARLVLRREPAQFPLLAADKGSS